MKLAFFSSLMLVSFALLLCASSITAQPAISWNKFFAGDGQDQFQEVINTEDGGYLLVGYSSSPASGDKSEDNEQVRNYEYVGDEDIWIIKVDANGDKLWDKTYGFGMEERVRSVIITQDGGFLLSGESGMVAGPCPCFQDIIDSFVLKIDKDGNEQWYNIYSNGGLDGLITTVAAKNGGYLLVGSSYTDPFKSEEDESSWDYRVIKIDESGNQLWDKTFGGASEETITSALVTEDGGFLLNGYSESDASLDKSEDGRGGSDYWVVKIDENGNKLWDKTFGGNSRDASQAVIPTTDGDYLLVGYSGSNASGDKSENITGSWVIRIDEHGNKLWDKIIGAEDNRLLTAIPAIDGNYLLAGFIPYEDRRKKAWAVKINGNGDVLWDQPIGNRKSEGIRDIITTPDGGYLLGGVKNVLEYVYDRRIGRARLQVYAGYWIVKIYDENSIADITLINADTDQVLHKLQDGAKINLSDLGNPQLTVQANTAPINVEKVSFELSGPISHTQVERNWPYALFGDDPNGPRDFIGRQWQPGEYTLTVTPHLAGKAGSARSIFFSVIDDVSSSVPYFVLVNADTDQDIRRLTDGDVIDLQALENPQLSIRANTDPINVDRVELSLSGPFTHTQKEMNWPYALFGDNAKAGPDRDYIGRDWQQGEYTLTATPYHNNRPGATATISFSVMNSSNNARLAVEVYPVPTQGEITISHEGSAEEADMMLIDQNGNVVLQQPLSSQAVEQLDLSSYKKGFYYLKVIQQQKVQVKRIVLE